MDFIRAIIMQLLGGIAVETQTTVQTRCPRHFEGDDVLTVLTDNGPIHPRRPY